MDPEYVLGEVFTKILCDRTDGYTTGDENLDWIPVNKEGKDLILEDTAPLIYENYL